MHCIICIGAYYHPQTALNCLVDIWLTALWWHAGDAEASLSVKPQQNSLSDPSTYIYAIAGNNSHLDIIGDDFSS